MRKSVLFLCVAAIILITIPAFSACNENEIYDFSDENYGYTINQDGEHTISLSTLINKELTNAVIPATVTHDEITYELTQIGEAAFAPQPDGVTLNEVFNYDNSQDESNDYLVSVNFEAGSKVTQLCGRAFERCKKLAQISLPENLKIISGFAFYKNVSLQTITIPSKVEKIDDYAFLGCTELKTVNLLPNNPSSIPSLGVDVFKWYDKSKVTFSGKQETYLLIEGMSIILQSEDMFNALKSTKSSIIATSRNWADYIDLMSTLEA
ncbi:MAG TPA: leucine-rich repeat domain-containing protein [Clostridia bacterium]|nr:leucine-rich repeat domain-containing protein [Clostridia bacterium]